MTRTRINFAPYFPTGGRFYAKLYNFTRLKGEEKTAGVWENRNLSDLLAGVYEDSKLPCISSSWWVIIVIVASLYNSMEQKKSGPSSGFCCARFCSCRSPQSRERLRSKTLNGCLGFKWSVWEIDFFSLIRIRAWRLHCSKYHCDCCRLWNSLKQKPAESWRVHFSTVTFKKTVSF